MLIPELKKKVRQERIVQNPRGSLRPQGLPLASSLRKDSTSQYQTCSSLHCRHQEREAAPARTNIRWEPLGRDGSIWLGRRATPLPALTPRPPTGYTRTSSRRAFYLCFLFLSPLQVVSNPDMSIIAWLRRISWMAVGGGEVPAQPLNLTPSLHFPLLSSSSSEREAVMSLNKLALLSFNINNGEEYSMWVKGGCMFPTFSNFTFLLGEFLTN